MSEVKILALSGSYRTGSFSTRLLEVSAKELSSMDAEVTQISLENYPLPIYNGDLEAKEGVPQNAIKLAQLFNDHDAVVIISPEYNGSLSPLLKNAIDWMSRVSNSSIVPFKGKVCVIGSTSPGVSGGMSMLYHMRQILVRLGMLVICEQIMAPNAMSAFDDNGDLTDERSRGMMKASCKSLIRHATLLKIQQVY